MAEIGYADKGKNIRITTDKVLAKEPNHCHLIYRGEMVGVILLEPESKGNTFESKHRKKSLFAKKELLNKYDFVPEIPENKLNALRSLFYNESGTSAALGVDVPEYERDLIFMAKKFAVKTWGDREEFATFIKSYMNSHNIRIDPAWLRDFFKKELRITEQEATEML